MHTPIRKFALKYVYQIIGLEKCKKIMITSGIEVYSTVSLKMMHVSKPAVKTFQILEISRGKSYNSETSLEKTHRF